MDLAEWYDRLLQLFDYRCPITANCPITLSDYSCTERFVKNKAVDAPNHIYGNCNEYDYATSFMIV